MKQKTKICKQCGVEKILDDFHREGKWRRGKCKACINPTKRKKDVKVPLHWKPEAHELMYKMYESGFSIKDVCIAFGKQCEDGWKPLGEKTVGERISTHLSRMMYNKTDTVVGETIPERRTEIAMR